MDPLKLQQARDAGYSPKEIADYLAASNPKINDARSAGYNDDEILDHLMPKRSGYEQGARLVGQVAQNTNDALANTFGAPVDLVAAGLRKVGVPVNNPVGGSESLKGGIDYLATLPQRFKDAIVGGSATPLTEQRTSRFEPENRAEKIAAGIGEGVGNAVGMMVPAAGVARMAAPGTVTQGVARTLTTQPVMQATAGAVGGAVTGATDDPLLGLAASTAVPLAAWATRGAISPVTPRTTPQEQRIIATADREGIPLSPAQRTGSPGLRMIEDTMAKVPGSAGPMQRAIGEQRQQFNRAVLERAGITGNDASPETLAQAFVNHGQTFDDLARRTTVNVDSQFVADVNRTAMNYGRRLPTDVAAVFQSYVDDLTPLLQATQGGQAPQIAGDVYGTIRSDMAKTIRENQSRPALQRALGGLVEAFDSAMERSTSGALRGEWQDARRQYQALMTIDKAMQGGTQASRSAGDIASGGLTQAVRQSDKAGFARGRGQLNELARVGDHIASQTPNSGTATREAILNPLAWPMMLAGNLGARAYNTGPVQSYLTNQVAGTTNLPALYGSQAARSALDMIPSGNPDKENRALARALMLANERRRGATQ